MTLCCFKEPTEAKYCNSNAAFLLLRTGRANRLIIRFYICTSVVTCLKMLRTQSQLYCVSTRSNPEANTMVCRYASIVLEVKLVRHFKRRWQSGGWMESRSVVSSRSHGVNSSRAHGVILWQSFCFQKSAPRYRLYV